MSTLTPDPVRAEATAHLLRALANPQRLLILCQLLQGDEVSAGELAQRLGLAPSALSQHLSRMRAAGLVRSRRDARTLLYRVGDNCGGSLTRLLRGICVGGAATGTRGHKRDARTADVLNLVFAGAAKQQAPGFWQTPAIPGVGPVHALPDATHQPRAKGAHRLLFAVTAGAAPGQVSPGLARVARAVNLYASAGVPRRRMQFRAVVYGAATSATLDDAHYRTQFGTANPNLPVLQALRGHGVGITVCGQAIAGLGYDPDWVADGVSVALSGITAIAGLQQQGYALIPP